jgi:hypothetical protein
MNMSKRSKPAVNLDEALERLTPREAFQLGRVCTLKQMEDMLTEASKKKSWWDAAQREVLSLHAVIVKELGRKADEKFDELQDAAQLSR